jgi:hypothetical protein
MIIVNRTMEFKPSAFDMVAVLSENFRNSRYPL